MPGKKSETNFKSHNWTHINVTTQWSISKQPITHLDPVFPYLHYCFHFTLFTCLPVSLVACIFCSPLLSCCFWPPLCFFPHTCPAPLCKLFCLLRLSPTLSDCHKICVFLPLSSPISAPSQPSGYTPFLLRDPRWRCFLPAPSFPLLFLSPSVHFFSQHHMALKAKVPTLVTFPITLFVKWPSSGIPPSHADPGSLPYAALQSCRCDVPLSGYCFFACLSATLYVPTRFPSLFSLQVFYFSLGLSFSRYSLTQVQNARLPERTTF